MGAAGSAKWKVLRIDPEIPRGQNFPPSGFPMYFDLISSLTFSLGRTFPAACPWCPKEILKGALPGPQKKRATQRTAGLPWVSVTALGSLGFSELRIDLMLLFLFTLSRNVLQTRREEHQYVLPESQSVPLYCHQPSLKKGIGWVAFCFWCRFAHFEMLEIENRCFNEVIPILEKSEFKVYFVSQLSLIWLINNFKKLYQSVCQLVFITPHEYGM